MNDPTSAQAVPPTGRTPRPWWATLLIRYRFPLLAVVDAVAWLLAILLTTWGRYEFELGHQSAGQLTLAVVLVVAVQLLAGTWQGLYVGRWHLGSFEEVAGLLKSVAMAMVVLFFVDLPVRWVPISVPLLGMFVALVQMAGFRYAWRLAIERRKRPGSEYARRALVFGAGEGAAQLVTATLRDPDSPYLPVALLDDDPGKRHLRVRGVRVLGNRHDLGEVAERLGAEVLIIAIPSADAALMRDLSDLAARIDLPVAVLPPVRELLDTGIGVAQVRPLSDADLLGRHAIDTDVASIAGYLTDKVVLVTGAGGSIGSELCRQIARYAPSDLVLLDHDESALHACQLSLDGRGQLDSPNLVVASIRDAERVRDVFEAWRPDVVFHAAALKHVPLLELHPEEAVKTNVWGTQHVLTAAAAVGVDRFVNISTDKAADPVNMLGRTKRVAEMLTAGMADRSPGRYLSVRFGNVLGSRGSVLTAWRAQIERGGPVTVTDPEVTRYFMTVQEAVQLVIQAGAIGEDGEVLVLDMGQPVRIAEVAERMVAAAGGDVEIVYTGLRPGEKVHEVLLSHDEAGEVRRHPLITHVRVPVMDVVPPLEQILR